jgi:transcriptional regulator of acetoin/glycerol metabolism
MARKRAEPGHYARCIDEFTRDYLLELLDDCSFNITAARQFSGMGKTTLYTLIKRYGITREVVWARNRKGAA